MKIRYIVSTLILLAALLQIMISDMNLIEPLNLIIQIASIIFLLTAFVLVILYGEISPHKK